MGKLEKDEEELLDSVEAGEWQPVPDREKELERYRESATATFKKDRRKGGARRAPAAQYRAESS